MQGTWTLSVSPSAIWINSSNAKSKKSTSSSSHNWFFISNVPVICEEAEQVIFDGGSILHFILWEKNIRCLDAGLKYASYVTSNVRSASVVLDSNPAIKECISK